MIGNFPFLQSSTSIGYISNSTGSSVTNCRYSPIIVLLFVFEAHHLWFIVPVLRSGSFRAYIVVGQDPSDSKSNWLHVDIHLPVLQSFI